MTSALLRRAGLAAVLLFVAFAALAQAPVPALKARVTDLTGTLTADQRTSLEERLAGFEGRKGTQIAVLIVPTTQPETIERSGIRVAEQAKVGRKGVDDGAVLIVAVKDRTLRIEVGYGLEGVLPDAVAKRIVEDYIVPRFKQGDFYGGINEGVGRMMSLVEGEALPPPKAVEAPAWARGGLEAVIIGFMLVFVVGGIIRALLGRFLGSAVIGGIAGFAGNLILGSLAGGAVVGVVAAILSLMGGISRWTPPGGGDGGGWGSGPPGGGWGGWHSGRGGGWSGGGGGGSWGGGGGGGFGGGGASGRW